jgi:alkyl hydroperoxide reductase subunit AhpC
MAVRIGKPAPEFEEEAWTRGAHGPKRVGLSQHRGKWVVLFFYPRDFTFICPTEIASFGAMQKDFERENAVVIGVSTDSFYTAQSVVRIGSTSDEYKLSSNRRHWPSSVRRLRCAS